MALAIVPFCLGFVGILFDERRRAWDDRLSRADVLSDDERRHAPWSRLEPVEAAPSLSSAAETTKAPEARGLRPRHVAGSSS
jgi:hypothetical protein